MFFFLSKQKNFIFFLVLNPKEVSVSQDRGVCCLQLRGEVSCPHFPMEKLRNGSHCRHRAGSLQGPVCSPSAEIPKSPPRHSPEPSPALSVGCGLVQPAARPSTGVFHGKTAPGGAGQPWALCHGQGGGSGISPLLRGLSAARRRAPGCREGLSCSVCSALAAEPLLPEIKGAVLGHRGLAVTHMPAAAVGPGSSPTGRGKLGVGHSKLGRALLPPHSRVPAAPAAHPGASSGSSWLC